VAALSGARSGFSTGDRRDLAEVHRARRTIPGRDRGGRRRLAGWRGRTADDRARVLRRFADLVADQAESLATLISREGGKPLAEARGEVATGSRSWLVAEEATRIYGELVPAWHRTSGSWCCISRSA